MTQRKKKLLVILILLVIFILQFYWLNPIADATDLLPVPTTNWFNELVATEIFTPLRLKAFVGGLIIGTVLAILAIHWKKRQD